MELQLDDLDEQKIEKIREQLGEETADTLLKDQIKEVVRNIYDQKEQLQEKIQQQQQ